MFGTLLAYVALREAKDRTDHFIESDRKYRERLKEIDEEYKARIREINGEDVE